MSGFVGQPPFNDDPMHESGRFTQPWTRWMQDQARAQQEQAVALQDLTAALAAALAVVHLGVTDGSDAAAGDVGEYLDASAAGVTLASATDTNIVTLALTAGDWMVWGNITFAPDVATVPYRIMASVSATSATQGAVATDITGQTHTIGGVPVDTFGIGAPVQIGSGGPVRFSLAAPATAYLVGRSSYTIPGGGVGSMLANGVIAARRLR